MSAITTTPPTVPSDPGLAQAPLPTFGDHRTVFRGVSWEVYRSLSQAYSDGEHVRLAYDGKDLEIMTTGNLHENLKELISRIVTALASWVRIAIVSFGEATLDAVNAERGLQADLSYCFDPEKVRVARAALARESMEPTDYPKPDLAVEIDISPSRIDRPSIYGALRVAEVWRVLRGRTVVIEHLQSDGSYAPAEASRFLPIRAEEITAWLTAEDVGLEEVWNRRLHEWAMELGRRA
jgi:Uma2 family endonuclease